MKKAKKRVRRRLPVSSSDEEEVAPDAGQETVMPTPPPHATKKKRFPVSDHFRIDLKDKLRNNEGGKKPWVEITAKKDSLLVKFMYPGPNNLVSKTRKVAYPKPGHPLILCDD
jgi:hypothetical protein